MAGDKYKLTYFNLPALGESIRYLLHALDIPFEDHRIEFSEWPNLKPKIPTHQLPYLEVTDSSGKTVGYSESLAIARFVARQHNMIGETNDQYYKVERMIGQCMDIMHAFLDVFHNPERKEQLEDEFKKEKEPRLLGAIRMSLKESGGKFVAGDKPSLGDFVLLVAVEHAKLIDPHLTIHPEIAAHREAVLKAFPKLEAYIKQHPFVYPRMRQ
ncbi:unnamed protein product [Calicophoron daubneyi]|uniref:Glutathione S-transferase n=1 Tax=Calicophoron daubneyi TaxID=300641 RepID=A0AAV2T653_CALDB